MKTWVIEYVSKVGRKHEYPITCNDKEEAERFAQSFSQDPLVAAVTNLIPILPDEPSNIKPSHYNKGDIDLFEAAYLTRPFNEVRAILEFTAERYIKRDKNDRVEDISKAIETLRRLKEYEEREREND